MGIKEIERRERERKKVFQRQFPVDSLRFFVEEEGAGFGPDLSRPRDGSYMHLRWVYLRTKWFLFGLRASCASHGGFVAAAAAAWGKIVRQANKSKDAPRVGGEPLHLHLLLASLNLPSYILCDLRVYACVCVRPTDRPRNERAD